MTYVKGVVMHFGSNVTTDTMRNISFSKDYLWWNVFKVTRNAFTKKKKFMKFSVHKFIIIYQLGEWLQNESFCCCLNFSTHLIKQELNSPL